MPFVQADDTNQRWKLPPHEEILAAIHEDSAREFLREFTGDLRPNEYLALRALKKGHKPRLGWAQSYGEIRRFVDGLGDGWDVYFGVAPRDGKHGDAAHVSRLMALWCDVDAKCFEGGKAEAREALNLIPLRPTYVVDSGNGYHAYWLLGETASKERFAAAQDVMIGIRDWFSDHAMQPLDSVHDLARILRVPGTANYKGSPELPVTVDILSVESERRYRLEEFVQAGLVKRAHESTRKSDAKPNSYGLALDDELLKSAASAANGTKFLKLWEGDFAGYKSQSEADAALVAMLAYYTREPAQLDRLFRRSALVREKWDERHGAGGETYGAMTIRSALALVDATARRPTATAATSLFVSVEDILSAKQEATNWVIKPYVAAGAITEFVGKPKLAGKSTLILRMVAATTTGQPFLGHANAPVSVVYLTEEREATFQAALERAGITDGVSVLFWHRASDLVWDDVVERAIQECRRTNAKLLVVDTLSQFAGLSGDTENNGGHARDALRPLQKAAAAGLAVVIIRHERKAGGDLSVAGIGATAFSAGVDIIVLVRRAGHTLNRRVLEALGRLDGVPEVCEVELRDSGYILVGTEKGWADRAADEALRRAPTSPDRALTLEELRPENVSTAAMRRAATRQRAAGTLGVVGKGVRDDPRRYYRLSLDDDE